MVPHLPSASFDIPPRIATSRHPMPSIRRLSSFVSCVFLAFPVLAAAENWPGWRGPRGDGWSLESGVPTNWNGEAGENIAWKTPIPGTGHRSPIVWEDRMFVVSCLNGSGGDAGDRVLLCLDRKSGAVMWQQTVLKAPLEKKHTLNSHASGTPATDGKLVYVSFLAPDFASLKERTPGV